MFTFALGWDWLLTKNDRRLIAQAREQEQEEILKTEVFIERLSKIEPETIVTELEKLYKRLEDRGSV